MGQHWQTFFFQKHAVIEIIPSHHGVFSLRIVSFLSSDWLLCYHLTTQSCFQKFCPKTNLQKCSFLWKWYLRLLNSKINKTRIWYFFFQSSSIFLDKAQCKLWAPGAAAPGNYRSLKSLHLWWAGEDRCTSGFSKLWLWYNWNKNDSFKL